MRVQRAPQAAEQPQRPPAGYQSARQLDAPAPAMERTAQAVATAPVSPSAADARGGSGASFSAGVDLDLTGPLRRLEEPQVVAEIIARLVFACRHEGVSGAQTVVRLVRPTSDGLVGVILEPAVSQSLEAIISGLASHAGLLPPATPDTFTVVCLQATRARPAGDWGLGGLAVATLGPIVPTLMSFHQAGDSALGIAERQVAHLGITVSESVAHAHGVVRALDVVVRSVEDPDR